MMKKKVNRNNLIQTRLSDEEFEIVNKMAEENYCSISHLVRVMIFKKAGNAEANVESIFEKNILRIIKTFVNSIGELVRAFVSISDKHNGQIVERVLGDILKNVIDIKTTLIYYFGSIGNMKQLETYKEIMLPVVDYPVVHVVDYASNDNKTVPTAIASVNKCNYAQMITICGKILTDPQTITSKKGIEMVKFKASSYNYDDDQPVVYDVFANKSKLSKIASSMTIGRQIMVLGTFKIRRPFNKKGFPQNTLVIHASEVELGKKRLA